MGRRDVDRRCPECGCQCGEPNGLDPAHKRLAEHCHDCRMCLRCIITTCACMSGDDED